MSVIASSAIENDEDLVITGATSRAMVKMLNEESDKESSVDEDAFEKDESSSAEESESDAEEKEDEESLDSEAERINEMADQYEENLARGNEHAMVTDKRHARKAHKTKLLIEQ